MVPAVVHIVGGRVVYLPPPRVPARVPAAHQVRHRVPERRQPEDHRAVRPGAATHCDATIISAAPHKERPENATAHTRSAAPGCYGHVQVASVAALEATFEFVVTYGAHTRPAPPLQRVQAFAKQPNLVCSVR